MTQSAEVCFILRDFGNNDFRSNQTQYSILKQIAPNNKNQEPRNFARFGVRLGPDTKIASREHRTVIGKCTHLEGVRWLGLFKRPLI